MYKIMCFVTGGRTGTRSALLKDGDSKPKEFTTRAEADAEASHLNKTMNNKYSIASFKYTVVAA